MTDIENKYLKLAVIEQVKFDEISKILEIDRVEVSNLWGKLKDQREYLSALRRIWKSKFEKTKTTESFWKFKEWYETTEKKCFYCGITENQITELFQRKKIYTKRNRGRKLEIERLLPNEPYDNIKNLVFSCYWCNNAKTDTFSSDEFKIIGRVIGEIWKKRLTE
jgi:5-methylcytosine-specific restriction endonuclease McrA